ncbi:MAG: STAS-like domain-containing protein [Nitrospirae bacterium]|nr:STAS-like domain-containing protein [Magnetococcales bacterium]
MKRINVATDFHRGPSGRYVTDGNYSGERFREEFLVPALKSPDQVQVDFTDAKTPGSSFLEEAFGGIVRKKYFTAIDLQSRLEIITHRSLLKDLITKYINEAIPE